MSLGCCEISKTLDLDCGIYEVTCAPEYFDSTSSLRVGTLLSVHGQWSGVLPYPDQTGAYGELC